MHDLRNVYPQDSDDHKFLHRAAKALLKEVPGPVARLSPAKIEKYPAIAWYLNDRLSGEESADATNREIDHSVLQGGILYPYRQVTHGCLLLATVDDAEKARQFIAEFAQRVTKDADVPRNRDAATAIYKNIAFTFSGLQKQVPASVLARLPKEFREGMDARAGLLGDIQWNHPDNWTLPAGNVRYRSENGIDTRVEFVDASAGERDQASPPVRMSSIDIVILLHCTNARMLSAIATRGHTTIRCRRKSRISAKTAGSMGSASCRSSHCTGCGAAGIVMTARRSRAITSICSMVSVSQRL